MSALAKHVYIVLAGSPVHEHASGLADAATVVVMTPVPAVVQVGEGIVEGTQVQVYWVIGGVPRL